MWHCTSPTAAVHHMHLSATRCRRPLPAKQACQNLHVQLFQGQDPDVGAAGSICVAKHHRMGGEGAPHCARNSAPRCRAAAADISRWPKGRRSSRSECASHFSFTSPCCTPPLAPALDQPPSKMAAPPQQQQAGAPPPQQQLYPPPPPFFRLYRPGAELPPPLPPPPPVGEYQSFGIADSVGPGCNAHANADADAVQQRMCPSTTAGLRAVPVWSVGGQANHVLTARLSPTSHALHCCTPWIRLKWCCLRSWADNCTRPPLTAA